jgi:hypothetical protein
MALGDSMKPVDRGRSRSAGALWTKTPPFVLAQEQSKQLTAYFAISPTGSVNRFQVWDGIEMLFETASLETAMSYYDRV